MLVFDVRRFERFREQLRQVARADVRAQVALVVGGVVSVCRRVEVSRRADANHHHAHAPPLLAGRAGVILPAAWRSEVHRAAGEQEAHMLVSRLRPAVEVVGERQQVGVERFHLARVYQVVFVPVGGVVGARHRHARRAGVVGGAKDVVRHLDVRLLVEEVVERVVARAPLVAEMNHAVHALEQARVSFAVRVGEVLDYHAFDLLAAPVDVRDVHEDGFVALAERRQQLVGDVSRRAGD